MLTKISIRADKNLCQEQSPSLPFSVQHRGSPGSEGAGLHHAGGFNLLASTAKPCLLPVAHPLGDGLGIGTLLLSSTIPVSYESSAVWNLSCLLPSMMFLGA